MRTAVTLLAVVGIAATTAAAQGRLHTLVYLEGRYSGAVSLTDTSHPYQAPVLRSFPAVLEVRSQGEALMMAWAIGNERQAAAIVGTIGPSAYAPPTSFEDLDWDCRPAPIPPFQADARKIALKLVCFTPGGLARPAVAHIELSNGLDRARRLTDRLEFRVDDLRQQRSFDGTLRHME